MSRHRNVRSMNYNDEYDGYDDVYGHSVDDDSCSISPTDASQWIYDRERGRQSISEFLANNEDIEEGYEDDDDDGLVSKQRRDSEHFIMPTLSDEDSIKLHSCIDEIRNVVGEYVSEKQLVETIMRFNFDCTKALDAVLNVTAAPSPPTFSAERKLDGNFGSTSNEKDLNSKLSRSEDKTFTNLSDLAKFHLTNTNEQISSDSPQPFKLPNLFSISNTNVPISLPKLNFGNKLHSPNSSLISNQTSNPINLPKFNFSNMKPNSISPITSISPHQSSIQKIMELKKLSLNENIVQTKSSHPIDNKSKLSTSPVIENDWVVDLTTALKSDNTIPIAHVTTNNNSILDSNITNVSETENFIPKFIDCADFYKTQVSRDCEIDCSSILIKILNIRKRNATKFGRTLCKRYKIDYKPKICHEFKPKNRIKCYNFASPSPDDLVQLALTKAKMRN